jgi:divalent metal cation (Fe/Co/Zn/Cd) transporter
LAVSAGQRPWHDEGVIAELHAPVHEAGRRVRFLQVFTLAWMTGEAAASLLAAWMARSPALLAFGGDSLIELLSAAVVLWRFTTPTASEQAERRAARIAGVLLLLLAAYVALVAVLALLGYHQPQPSLFGICVLIAAAAVMPWLGWEKRKLSASTGSSALRADAAESSLCAYLALIALAGLLVNYFWKVGRADSIAALAIIPFIVYEAREALRGKACDCL